MTETPESVSTVVLDDLDDDLLDWEMSPETARRIVRGLQSQLAEAREALREAEKELAKYRANPLWNIRSAPEPPWCDECQIYGEHDCAATDGAEG